MADQGAELAKIQKYVFTSSDLLLETERDGRIVTAEGDCHLLNEQSVDKLCGRNLFDQLEVSDINTVRHQFLSLEPGQRVTFDDKDFAPAGRRISIKRSSVATQQYRVFLTDLINHHVLETRGADENLLAAFRTSITSPELSVALQPVVNCQTGDVHHYEMLSRFPVEGSPYPMIVAAEKRGIIHELDCIMLAAACNRLASLGDTNVQLAVNISGESIQRDDVIEKLGAIVDAARFDKQRLILEITESSHIHDIEKAARMVDQLRARKVQVVLDDFGAGAASFGYLRSMNVDGVKFDGCFLNGHGDKSRNAALMRAVVGMCKELGMSVVGERVETDTDRQTLLDAGVEFAQGYYFGRPEIDPAFFSERRIADDAA